MSQNERIANAQMQASNNYSCYNPPEAAQRVTIKTPEPPIWARDRALEILGGGTAYAGPVNDRLVVNVAHYVMIHEKEPADPLVEALEAAQPWTYGMQESSETASNLREALAKRGYAIVPLK